MKKIEHKHHVFYENEIQEGKALDIIARFEKEGWEMCASHPFEGEEYGVIFKCYFYYFKRGLNETNIETSFSKPSKNYRLQRVDMNHGCF